MTKENEKTQTLLLTGIGASHGRAVGRVKIITGKIDSGNFKEGEILVAKITDPSMVSLMARSGAVITDIGGITSHPAITCRELGIPCVVATKNATTALKDGMKVIVDGSAGKIFLAEDESDDFGGLIEAYRQAFASMDTNTFEGSTDYTKLDPLIAKVWTGWLLKVIAEIKRQGLTPKEVGRLLHSPSTMRNTAIFELFMASIAGLPLVDREKIGNFFTAALKAVCLQDPFALDHKNVIHTAEEIKKEAAKARPADPAIARKLGRLISAGYHLGYSLYGDMNPQLAYENYGPYHTKDASGEEYLVVIKEFKNLKPVEIWPETAELPFAKIRIVSLYQNVDFTIDAITHTNYQGDIINGLKFYAIEVDDQPLAIEKIDALTETIEKKAEEIWEKFKDLSDAKFRIKYLYQKAYVYCHLCQRLGLDWQPTKELIAEITGKPLAVWPKFEDARAGDEYFLNIIDPRTDFAG